MKPRLVKCFFYRVVVRESIEASNKVLNIDYTISSTNIDRAKKHEETKQTKSLNQSTINQNINPLGRPGT